MKPKRVKMKLNNMS